MTESESDQSRKFKQAARDLECNEDEKTWEERLRKVAKHRPASERPE
jgi:hypothetical protein